MADLPTRVRRMCGTMNNNVEIINPPLTDLLSNPVFFNIQGSLAYMEAAQEIGESGTPHLQIYAEFKKAVTISAAAKLLPGVHWTPCSGSQSDNLLYIRKGNQPKAEWLAHKQFGEHYGQDLSTVIQFGSLKTQGARNDLAPVAQAVLEGKRLRDIAEEHPEQFIKHHRGITAYRDALSRPRSSSVAKQVIVLFGPTGTGKTRQATEDYPDAYLWGPEQGKWFNGYDGHDTVILDEFRGQLPFGYLLRLLDRYRMKVEIKGGMTEFIPDRIIICSPTHPSNWYDLEGKDGAYDQLERRLSDIQDFSPAAPPPVLETQFE